MNPIRRKAVQAGVSVFRKYDKRFQLSTTRSSAQVSDKISLRRLLEVDRVILKELPLSEEKRKEAISVAKKRGVLSDLYSSSMLREPVDTVLLRKVLIDAVNSLGTFPAEKREKLRVPEHLAFLENQLRLIGNKQSRVIPSNELTTRLRVIADTKFYFLLGKENYDEYVNLQRQIDVAQAQEESGRNN
ncbi:MAG: hypothetical protein WCW44_03310 [archaeon]